MLKKILKKIIVTLLTLEARMVIRKYKPKIIGVTGSVGKTSTKDAIFCVLPPKLSARKSDKSYNSDIGVPLAVLGQENPWGNPAGWLRVLWNGLTLVVLRRAFPEWLVLEVGADHPGDIRKICTWIKPDIAVITKFGKTPVHVEHFASRADVIKEKMYLAKALKPEGALIVNYDDADSLGMKDKIKRKSFTYGFDEKADFYASHFEIFYGDVEGDKQVPTSFTFRVNNKGQSVPVWIKGTVGRQHAYGALSAIAVGSVLKENLVSLGERLLTLETPPGRLKLIEGLKNTIIIDDSYNSSPLALASSLETLDELEVKGRKIAVLGGMLELGKHGADEHKKAGVHASKVSSLLVTVGPLGRLIAEGAMESGMSEKNVLQFEKSTEAGAYLQNLLEAGDVILVKGSQGTLRMERAVEEIMAHPEDKKKLLVRQDKEWEKR